MLHRSKAIALWTCFSAIALASCQQKRVVTNLTPPTERLQCAAAGARPTIPPEYQIDWAHVTSVAQAKIEHEGYVRSVRSREGVIAGYILDVEGRLFVCSNNMAWLREWYKGTGNGN